MGRSKYCFDWFIIVTILSGGYYISSNGYLNCKPRIACSYNKKSFKPFTISPARIDTDDVVKNIEVNVVDNQSIRWQTSSFGTILMNSSTNYTNHELLSSHETQMYIFSLTSNNYTKYKSYGGGNKDEDTLYEVTLPSLTFFGTSVIPVLRVKLSSTHYYRDISVIDQLDIVVTDIYYMTRVLGNHTENNKKIPSQDIDNVAINHSQNFMFDITNKAHTRISLTTLLSDHSNPFVCLNISTDIDIHLIADNDSNQSKSFLSKAIIKSSGSFILQNYINSLMANFVRKFALYYQQK